jgi:adenylate cyclase
MERKLAAILSADVKGYSRLMAADEVATVRTLTAYRQLMGSLIPQHRGRVVDSPGDNLLADFQSVVDAVMCAVEIQQALKARNAELPEHRRMEFRIGINLGDVIIEGERIYGDGVNVAARVEGLAEPGGICLSGAAYDQVEGKLALRYLYLGEQAVKNIAKPLRVYRVRLEPGDAPPDAAPGLMLPATPSLAVPPFVNMSGDPEQEYFSDGITEDIITALSKISSLFVIARTSTFAYKGKAVKVQQVGQELGVRYVLEGSVRKAGPRVRITAQLVEAASGRHLWAERYDRDLQDLFAVQDEITQHIVDALQVQLTEGEQLLIWRRHTRDPEVWSNVYKSIEHFRRLTKEDNIRARQYAQRAVELDPEYASAYNLLGWTHWNDARMGWSVSPLESFQRAAEFNQKALALDDSLAEVHGLHGFLYLYQRDYERAIAEGERAVALSPNGAEVSGMLAVILMYAGRPEEALRVIRKAMRLSPYHPGWYLWIQGMICRMLGRYEEAIATLKAAIDRDPNMWEQRAALAVTYSLLGRDGEARAELAAALAIEPTLSLESLARANPYKNPVDLGLMLDALRQVGLT